MFILWLFGKQCLLLLFAPIHIAAISMRRGGDPRGAKLPVRPDNGVLQRDSSAFPVKIVPVGGEYGNAVWNLPQEPPPQTGAGASSLTPEQRLKTPVDYYAPNGAIDKDYGGLRNKTNEKDLFDHLSSGTNLKPGTMLSSDGFNYLKREGPPTSPPAANPGGGTRQDSTFTTPPPLKPMDLSGVIPTVGPFPPPPNMKVDMPALNAPAPLSPSYPSLPGVPNPPNMARGPSLKGLPTWKGINAPKFSFGEWAFNLPSFNWNLNMKLPIWNPKFPAFNINVNLPKINIGLKFPAFEGPLYDTDASGKAPLADPVCTRDYSAKCPAGWGLMGKMCSAPLSYEGSCPRIMDFTEYSSRDLSVWSNDCKVKWPCLNDLCELNGGRDYSLPCPESWIYSENKGCSPNEGYQGGCKESSYDLGSSKDDQKELFATTCRVFWPCKTKACHQDYSAQCPLSFTFEKSRDACIKTPQATWTNCAETPTKASTWSINEKQEWSARCSARWPCAESKRTPCSRDYSPACPFEFTEIQNSGLCKIPDWFLVADDCPLNSTKIAFDGWSVNQKTDFENRCHVRWPCLGEVPANHGCPVGFHPIVQTTTTDSETLCESDTPAGDDPCKKTRNFNKMAAIEIQTLAKLCGFRWTNVQAESKITTLHVGADIGGSQATFVE